MRQPSSYYIENSIRIHIFLFTLRAKVVRVFDLKKSGSVVVETETCKRPVNEIERGLEPKNKNPNFCRNAKMHIFEWAIFYSIGSQPGGKSPRRGNM